MFLFLAIQLLISTGDQISSFDALRYKGRDALSESRYADAERLLKAAVHEAERHGAVDRSLLAVVLNDLGEAYRHMDRIAEAEARYKESASLLRQEPRAGRALVMVLNNLGAMYRERRLYPRAAVCHEEAMKVAKKVLPANDALLGTILHGLAAFSVWKGDLGNAQKQLERSLHIRQSSPAAGSHDVAETLNSLGTVQLRRKQYSNAEGSLRGSLTLMETLYGQNHTEVAAVLNNLGVVYLAEKKYAEAEQVLQRSLRIYRAILAAGDARIAGAAFNLAQLYLDQERFAESEPLLREVVAIRNAHGHSASDEHALAYERYAIVLRRNGLTADADAADARAKSIRSELRYTFKP